MPRNKQQNAQPQNDDEQSGATTPPPRGVSDRLIFDHADQILPGKALLVMLNGTGLATRLTALHPDVEWAIHTFEHFYLSSVLQSFSEQDVDANIELFCTPDLPDDEFDTILLATDSKSPSELARDLLQECAARLRTNGRLIVSTNNPRDHWLHKHLKETYGRTTCLKDKAGVCYIARRRETPVKQKNFAAEFAFRDGERLVPCESRPGVFSHRRLDTGARALIRSLDLLPSDSDSTTEPKRILEIGSGCGAVATAAALRYPHAKVVAIDSHARAVQCTERTAALNGVTNVSVVLTSDGAIPDPETYDLVLCNPPYYSDYRIAELFLQTADFALRQGGRLHVVTKQVEWHHNRVIEIFANADVCQFGEYHVVTAKMIA